MGRVLFCHIRMKHCNLVLRVFMDELLITSLTALLLWQLCHYTVIIIIIMFDPRSDPSAHDMLDLHTFCHLVTNILLQSHQHLFGWYISIERMAGNSVIGHIFIRTPGNCRKVWKSIIHLDNFSFRQIEHFLCVCHLSVLVLCIRVWTDRYLREDAFWLRSVGQKLCRHKRKISDRKTRVE